MELEQILAIVTPILSGIGGIIAAIAVFVTRIRGVVKVSKDAIHDHEEMQKELEAARRSIVDLTQKIGFLVEEAKAREKDAKAKRKQD